MYSNSRLSIASIARSASPGFAKILAVAVVATFGSGCALLSDQLDKAAKGAGKVVKEYCENITIPEVREEVKAAVNKHAAPHSVAIECVDGGPVLRTGEGEAISAPQPNETAPSPEAAEPSAYNFDSRVAVPMLAKKQKPIVIIETTPRTNPVIIIERRKKA